MRAAWQSVKNSLKWFWDGVLNLGLVLWVSRVSAVSTAIGAALFIFVPQVHDTYLEVRTAGVWEPRNMAFWALFLGSAVCLWTLPVHYAARRNLNGDPAFAGKPRLFFETRTPRGLAVLCLLSVAVGAYRAQSGLLSPPTSAFYKEALAQTQAIMWAAIVLAIVLLPFLIWRNDIFAKVRTSFGITLMAILGAAFLALFIVPPQHVTRALLWRAPLLPLLLGGWIPILA